MGVEGSGSEIPVDCVTWPDTEMRREFIVTRERFLLTMICDCQIF